MTIDNPALPYEVVDAKGRQIGQFDPNRDGYWSRMFCARDTLGTVIISPTVDGLHCRPKASRSEATP